MGSLTRKVLRLILTVVVGLLIIVGILGLLFCMVYALVRGFK